MLDVSIRISIMDLMLHLAEEFDVSYLYITHDLAVARYMCDRIAVMYWARSWRWATRRNCWEPPTPLHEGRCWRRFPFPIPPTGRPEAEIVGGISKAINPPPVCRFIERCPIAADICRSSVHPPLEEVRPGHLVSCYRAEKGVPD